MQVSKMKAVLYTIYVLFFQANHPSLPLFMNEGLNAGVRGFDRDDKNQHLIDSRIFVFVHRNDNYVKPEAVITGGYFTDTAVFGDLVLNKKQ